MRTRGIPLIVLSIVTLTAASTAAQAPQDSVAPQLIEYGETTLGSLGAGDPMLMDESYYKPYVFYGLEGEHVSISLASIDFNANLIVSDRKDSVIATDDNSGGDCNAQLQLVLPESGRYFVYANAAEPQEAGQFQLTVLRGIAEGNAGAACRGYIGHQGRIPVGDSVDMVLGRAGEPTLADGSFFHVWLLDNPDGVPFTADLISQDFDGLLTLVRGLREVAGHDDDGGGGCDARIAVAPGDGRPYRLVLVSRTSGRGGSYRLRLTEGLQPTLTEPACVPPGGE